MNSLDSFQENLLMAGTTYGWRLDAMVMGGLLWILMAVVAEAQRNLASPRARLVTVRG